MNTETSSSTTETTAAVSTAQPRLNYRKASPAAVQAMFALQMAANKGGIEKP
ncbi:MAG: hypothetical protein QM760_01580 [Nibricoccus sp.]